MAEFCPWVNTYIIPKNKGIRPVKCPGATPDRGQWHRPDHRQRPVATVGDAHEFRNGRQFAAWLGLTPRQYSTGGNSRLGRITKRGDVYLRTLLIHGARSELMYTARRNDHKSLWAEQLKLSKSWNKTAVALANKHARIAWSILAHDTEYLRA